MVEVLVNQEKYQVPEPGMLSEVLPLLGIVHADGIAIAVNENVIPRSDWNQHSLSVGDRVFVIRATQGG